MTGSVAGTSWTRSWSQLKSMPMCLAIHTDASHIKMFVVQLREPMHTAVESQPITKDKFVKFVSKSREGGDFAMHRSCLAKQSMW